MRVDFFNFLDHVFDYGARFAGSVAGRAHAPEAMKHDAGYGVNHRGEGGDGKNVTRDFDGAFFGGALDFVNVLGTGIGADVPDIAENGASVADQKSGKLAIVVPCLDDRLFVDFFAGFVEIEIHGGNVGLDAVHANVALALLLGIVERMRVEKRPDELAADIFEAEFEGGVLKDGVMAAVEGGCANVEALFIGDFFGSDEVVGVAGVGGGDGGIKWMSERVSEGHAWG